MEDWVQQILPSLGTFAPLAVLGWWVIRDQARRLEAAEAHNKELTKMVLDTSIRTAQVLAELKATLG